MSRLNSREITKMRLELIQKYGIEFCIICNKTPEMLGVPHLQLHESKYSRPLNLNNFFFMCKGCNLQKSLRRDLIIQTSSITAEHKKSIETQPRFRNWLFGEITKPENNGHLDYYVVLRQAAYEFDVEIPTITRWIKKLTDHPSSPYVTQAGNFGVMQIYLKGSEPELEDFV